MEQDKQKEQMEQQLIHDAAMVEEMTQHPGWKILGKYWQLVLDQEQAALNGQKMDESYYRKIGFTQMFRFCREIPGVIKDKRVAAYLLHQGRATGVMAAVKSPLFLLEGILKGNQIIREHFAKTQTQLVEKQKEKFHEENLR